MQHVLTRYVAKNKTNADRKIRYVQSSADKMEKDFDIPRKLIHSDSFTKY